MVSVVSYKGQHYPYNTTSGRLCAPMPLNNASYQQRDDHETAQRIANLHFQMQQPALKPRKKQPPAPTPAPIKNKNPQTKPKATVQKTQAAQKVALPNKTPQAKPKAPIEPNFPFLF